MALRIAKLCLLAQIIQPHAKPKLCQLAIFNANSVRCHLISAKQFCSLEHEVNTAALLKSALHKSLIQLLLELVTENFFMAHAAPHLELMNCCQAGMPNGAPHRTSNRSASTRLMSWPTASWGHKWWLESLPTFPFRTPENPVIYINSIWGNIL